MAKCALLGEPRAGIRDRDALRACDGPGMAAFSADARPLRQLIFFALKCATSSPGAMEHLAHFLNDPLAGQIHALVDDEHEVVSQYFFGMNQI